MKREVLDSEYEQIIVYLRSIGVNKQKVQAEMADHLLIVTELYMDKGADFYTAFQQAKKEIKKKDLVEISQNASSFKGYPKFLGKRFLIILSAISLLIFMTGLIMKYQHIPHHRIVIVVGRRLTSVVFLPLLLLHNFTERANRLKIVLNFIFQFVFFQTIADYLLHWKLNPYFSFTTLGIGLIWLVLYQLVPWFHSQNSFIN